MFLSLLLSLLLFGVKVLSQTEAYTRPNIIFLMADSMDGRNLDPTTPQYSLFDMPALRNIGNSGVNFIGHYTNNPQCVPGRAVLWTGRRTSSQRAWNNGFGFGGWPNGTVLDSNCIKWYGTKACKNMSNYQNNNFTIIEAMKSLNYTIYIYGKVDVGSGVLQQYNYSNADGFHNGVSHWNLRVFARSTNIRKSTMVYPASPHNLDDNINHVKKQDHQTLLDCSDLINKKLGPNKNKTDNPFFLYCSVNIPHPPFQSNETWLSKVDVNNVIVPPYIPDNKMHVIDRFETYTKNCSNNFTDETIIDIRKTYYAMNVETDYIFQGVINSAFANGFNFSNTIFMFTSDHGEMAMEHRQIWKNSMYEGSARIPLVIAGPGIKSGRTIRNFTSLIDLLPTLMVLGGAEELPSQLEGYSLTEYLYPNDSYFNSLDLKAHPNYITSQYHSNQCSTGMFMVRKDEWKFITYGHYLTQLFPNDLYVPQLFNVTSDPMELNDISNLYPEIVDSLNNILLSEYNFEFVDCDAKRSDFNMFETFWWNAYNESYLYYLFEQTYWQFNETDWNEVIYWRNLMLNASDCNSYANSVST